MTITTSVISSDDYLLSDVYKDLNSIEYAIRINESITNRTMKLDIDLTNLRDIRDRLMRKEK